MEDGDDGASFSVSLVSVMEKKNVSAAALLQPSRLETDYGQKWSRHFFLVSDSKKSSTDKTVFESLLPEEEQGKKRSVLLWF